MKTIAIILCLLASTAWAGEGFTVDSLQVADLTPTPITSMSFITGFSDEAGTLTWEGGVFKFSGNPDTSAQVLLDWLNQHYNTRAELYCQPKNAEIAKVLERADDQLLMQLTICELYNVECKYMRTVHRDIDAMLKRLK